MRILEGHLVLPLHLGIMMGRRVDGHLQYIFLIGQILHPHHVLSESILRLYKRLAVKNNIGIGVNPMEDKLDGGVRI